MPATDSVPAPPLDDETTAALTLFNEYVEADRERTQREKRVRKAERAKDEAASAVKKLGDRGTSEEHAQAEKAYRDAADRWKRLRDGEEPNDAMTVEEPPVEDPPAPAVEAADMAAPAETDSAEDPGAEDPGAADSVNEDPPAEDPPAADSVNEDPPAEDPATEDPAAEDA